MNLVLQLLILDSIVLAIKTTDAEKALSLIKNPPFPGDFLFYMLLLFTGSLI